jgi:spermidine synthase
MMECAQNLRGASVASESLNLNCGFHYAIGKVLHRHQSEWQLLEIVETPEFGRVMRVDGITMTSERDEFYYHENLVHVPALAHRSPENVLIIGGGDGGALEEVLKHACESPVARPHTFTRIVATLRSVFQHVRPYLVYVPMYGTWLAMATASISVDPIADSVEGILRRFGERKLGDLGFYNPATHFAAFALPNFVLDILRPGACIVTDAGEPLDRHPELGRCGAISCAPPSAATTSTATDSVCRSTV